MRTSRSTTPSAPTCSRRGASRWRGRAPTCGRTSRCAARTSATDAALLMLLFTVSDVAQQVVSGLSTGGVYASLSLALVIIYRSTGVINFAQGEMATASTFIALSLMHHMAYWPAFLLTCVIAFAGGVAVERVVIRPVENASVLTIVIVTLGLALICNGASGWI